jgi:myosin heavy subunit
MSKLAGFSVPHAEVARTSSGLSALKLLALVAVVGALVGTGYVFNSQKQHYDAELAKVRQDNQELEKLREENKTLKRRGNASDEIERLRQDNAELHVLRNEVKQLRDQKKQFDSNKVEVAQLRATVQQTVKQQQQVAAENQQLKAQQFMQQQQQYAVTGQRPPGSPGQPQYGVGAQGQTSLADPQQAEALRNACTANLKQLHGAIQQWALENKQTATSKVDLNGIRTFLAGGRIPACPAGGSYSFTTVANAPRCSVPGHHL